MGGEWDKLKSVFQVPIYRYRDKLDPSSVWKYTKELK